MSKRKLLLADDSITIQKVVNLTFADEGIEVIAVGDGDSAMQKFEEFMPDLVMADVNMPGLSGYEICQIVKQNDITRHIPVILLVGSFEPFDEEQARDVGADDFLTKPFQSIRQLVNKVTDLLNRDREQPASKSSVSDSLTETTEFEKQEAPVEDYGDAGMDDDMIETSPATGFAPDAEAFHQNETTIDYAKTQPLNPDDLKGFRALSDSDEEVAEAPSDDVAEIPDLETETSETNETLDSDPEEPKLDYYSPEPIAEVAAPVFAERAEESFHPDTETRPALDELDPFIAPESSVETQSFDETFEIREPVSFAELPTPAVDDEMASDDSPVDISAEEELYAAQESVETEAETEFAETDLSPESDELPVPEPDDEESSAEVPAQTTFEAPTEVAELETELEDVPLAVEPAPVEMIDERPVSAVMSIPSLGYDDGDLLDLPPLVDETGIRPSVKLETVEEPAEAVAPPVAETSAVAEPEAVAVSDAPASVDVLQSFPPELIEAIARKVAEQISAKTMSDVLPQITEMVMRKLAEEKKE